MLDVSNMKCGGCTASVKRILLSDPGVQKAAVNLLTETAVVRLHPGRSSADGAATLLSSKAQIQAASLHLLPHTTCALLLEEPCSLPHSLSWALKTRPCGALDAYSASPQRVHAMRARQQ